MTQSDAGAVDVGDIPVQPQSSFAGQILRGKSFIDFNLTEITDFKA
jgi:hypothetical protein